MNTFRLSLNLLSRDWRAGEWRILIAAIVLAVGSVSTVSLFGDRVRQALNQEAASLLGADLRISSTRILPPAYREAAINHGLNVVETASFASMVTHNSESILAEVLAVTEGYPLRGKIEIYEGTGSKVVARIPARSTLWADDRLITRFNAAENDEVKLGALRMKLAARIMRDVDHAIGFSSFAPRVIVNMADLPQTGLIQEGSRVNYRLLVSGEAAKVATFRNEIQPQLHTGEKLEDIQDARPEIHATIDRTSHYIGLAALTSVMLAGIAIALASRRFIARHLDACAMMRCMGAKQSQLLLLFLWQFLVLGVIASLIGCLLGYAAQCALVKFLPALPIDLPAPGLTPVLQALATGLAMLLGFAFLPLWQLKNTSPLRVLRRELGLPETGTAAIYIAGLAVLSALFLWQAGSVKLGETVLGGLVAALLVSGFLAWMILRACSRSHNRALLNLSRHAKSNAIQIAALSLGGMALLALTTVRTGLLESWHTNLPVDAPNHFIVNIQPDQRDAVADFFAREKLPAPRLFPMVRGRLIAINEHNINGDNYPDPRARALIERETNLSWLDTLPPGNELLGANDWLNSGSNTVSLEEGFAKTLNIAVGDTLTFDVAGSRISALVASLRRLRWDSMQVNFFVIASPGLLENLPASYITSFYLPPELSQASNDLIKTFPNLLLIDTQAMVEELRRILDQVAQAVGGVFLFTLLGGLMVLYAATQSTQDERILEAALMRTLGANGVYLKRLHLTEFALLGALSGAFAATGAALMGMALASKILGIPYRPSVSIWLYGVILGAAIVSLAGWIVTRHTTQLPPLQVLQAA
jgi:putative ABC transport system permease protein